MGAAEFSNVLVGKDLSKEFSRAQEQAAWEHGHGGYTGTIAEKSGYVNVGPLPSRMSLSRLQELIDQYEAWTYDKEGTNPVPENWRPFVKKVAEIYGDKWGPAVVVEIKGPAAVATKKRMGRYHTRDKVWVAFGLASE